MPPVDFTPRATAEVLKFQEEGPFTFNELLRVAKLCARTKTVRVQLSQVLYRFPDEELVKFIKAGHDPSEICTRRVYQKLVIGIGMNEIFHLNLTRFTDSQLTLLEQTMNAIQFENVVWAANFWYLPAPERTKLLGMVRLSQVVGSVD
jgi:hypothetical protein